MGRMVTNVEGWLGTTWKDATTTFERATNQLDRIQRTVTGGDIHHHLSSIVYNELLRVATFTTTKGIET